MEISELLQIQMQRLDACKMRLSLEKQKVKRLENEVATLKNRLNQKEIENQALES